MSLVSRIVRGKTLRKSRLYDEKGNFVTWNNIVLHAAPALISAILRISFGQRPILPWIAYTSIRSLEKFLNKDSRVLEFGSGMSTIWYAKHAGEVYSVEDHRPWYDRVSKIIEANQFGNIHYTFLESESDYTSFMSDDIEGFDLVMIDGSYRSKCIYHASKLVRPGGILYLDNSDKNPNLKDADMRIAEDLLRNFARESNAEITEITDFAPTQFFAQQGILARLPTD